MRCILVLALLFTAGGGLAALERDVRVPIDLRLTVRLLSPDFELDTQAGNFDGEWDGLAFDVELGMVGNLRPTPSAVDLAGGMGIFYTTAEEDLGGSSSSLRGGGLRYYLGAIMDGDDFSLELLPYVAFGLTRLQLNGGDGDVAFLFDGGLMANAAVSFGGVWQLGLSAGVGYRWGSYDIDLGAGDSDVEYQQLAFQYGGFVGWRF